MVAGVLNGYVGRSADGYEGVHGGFRYGGTNQEGNRILEMVDPAGWNDMVDNAIKKRRLWKAGSSKESYLEGK